MMAIKQTIKTSLASLLLAVPMLTHGQGAPKPVRMGLDDLANKSMHG